MKIKDRLDDIEMGMYSMSRPDCKTNSEVISISSESSTLFSCYATGAVRLGIVHAKITATSSAKVTMLIKDSSGAQQGPSAVFDVISGTFSYIYPFYYNGVKKIYVNIQALNGLASISQGNAQMVVFGGK